MRALLACMSPSIVSHLLPPCFLLPTLPRLPQQQGLEAGAERWHAGAESRQCCRHLCYHGGGRRQGPTVDHALLTSREPSH